MQCVAVCCSVLQLQLLTKTIYNSVCWCNVLQCVAVATTLHNNLQLTKLLTNLILHMIQAMELAAGSEQPATCACADFVIFCNQMQFRNLPNCAVVQCCNIVIFETEILWFIYVYLFERLFAWENRTYVCVVCACACACACAYVCIQQAGNGPWPVQLIFL